MSILPVNGNERAWFGFSARSRRQATAITLAHRHETFSCNPAADAIGRSGGNGHGPDLRRKVSRTIRRIGAGVRREAVPEQNQSCPEQRCGCGGAARAHACILRMLRLAFVSARTLAARETTAHVSKCIVCRAGARGAAKEPYGGKFETGSCVSPWRREDEFRTPIWIGVAAAIMCRVAR